MTMTVPSGKRKRTCSIRKKALKTRIVPLCLDCEGCIVMYGSLEMTYLAYIDAYQPIDFTHHARVPFWMFWLEIRLRTIFHRPRKWQRLDDKYTRFMFRLLKEYGI